MFYKYEIRNNGIEDILYLYLTMSYEFSKELGLKSTDREMCRRTKNFIRNNHIDYHGSKVYLVINGIVVKTLDIQRDLDIEVLKENLFYSNDYYLVTVQLEDNSFVEISLREYLLGVLATNIPPHTLQNETVKALAVLYRTFAFLQMKENGFVPAVNDWCIYKPISYYKLAWIDTYDSIYQQLSLAISDTDCFFLTFDHYYILPFIHFSNGGQTFSDPNYPYLTSVRSLWDLASPYYTEVSEYSYSELSKLFKNDVSVESDFSILETDEKNFVRKIKIANTILSGKQLMQLLQLKSLDMNLIVNRESLRIITKGWGNGLGLSIFGSDELSKNGCDFANILKYYFPNVQLNKYIKELS